MIGAFYQPKAVIADISVLKTLPQRELSAGIAEVVKYGLICNTQFYSWLNVNMEALAAYDVDTLATAVELSCLDKAAVVAQDEREGGIRAILNLGHTFGHAIETNQGYGVWLHGEAVGAGMVMAAETAELAGMISAEEAKASGLVNHVVTQEELLPLAEKIASKIMRNSSVAISAAIRAVNSGFVDGENGYNAEINEFGACFGTEDFEEGTTAFLNKRKPNF